MCRSRRATKKIEYMHEKRGDSRGSSELGRGRERDRELTGGEADGPDVGEVAVGDAGVGLVRLVQPAPGAPLVVLPPPPPAPTRRAAGPMQRRRRRTVVVLAAGRHLGHRCIL